MENNKNKENFLKLVSENKSGLLEKLQWRKDNEYWLKKSEAIALKVLRTIRAKGINQKMLAEKMGVSAQHINKLLKGQENFSLQTIGKLEQVLETELIEIAGKNVSMTQSYNISSELITFFKVSFESKQKFKTVSMEDSANRPIKSFPFNQYSKVS